MYLCGSLCLAVPKNPRPAWISLCLIGTDWVANWPRYLDIISCRAPKFVIIASIYVNIRVLGRALRSLGA